MALNDSVRRDENPILDYYARIESGDVIASDKVRQIYARLAREVREGTDRWEYDANRANHAIEFIERFCRHSKGACGGQPLILELWQRALVAAAFGFIDPIDGIRRFREVLLYVGRKNGKSTLAAAIGLYLMLADQEPGPEIYTAATKRDQAKIIWQEAKRMVKKSPVLLKRVKPLVGEITAEFNDGVFKPLGADSDTIDGLNVHGALLDEIHAWKTKELYDVIVDGAGSREQPLIFITTTAGVVRESICDIKYDEAKIILQDESAGDRFLPIIYELDKREEWTDPDAWMKANPGLGTIKNLETLQEKVGKAERNPRLVKNLLCKEFNIPETSDEVWLPFETINNEATFDIDELKPRYGIGGVDLSATTDLTCATLLFMLPGDNTIYVDQMYWVPEDLLDARERDDKIPYRTWLEMGLLRTSLGNKISYTDVTQWFIEMQERHDVYLSWCGYDNWSAVYWVEEMAQQFGEWTMEAVIQGKKTLSSPMKSLGADLEAKRVNYNNNPILKWCMTNTAIDEDRNGNIQPRKTMSPRRRIDGFASLLNAYVALERHYEEYQSMI